MEKRKKPAANVRYDETHTRIPVSKKTAERLRGHVTGWTSAGRDTFDAAVSRSLAALERKELISRGGIPLMDVPRGELFRIDNKLVVHTTSGAVAPAEKLETEAWEKAKTEILKSRAPSGKRLPKPSAVRAVCAAADWHRLMAVEALVSAAGIARHEAEELVGAAFEEKAMR